MAEGDNIIGGDIGPGDDLFDLLKVTKLSNLREVDELDGVGSYPKEECL